MEDLTEMSQEQFEEQTSGVEDKAQAENETINNTTNLQTIGDQMYSLQNKQGILNGEILSLQEELAQTPLSQKIRTKKEELMIVQRLEKEKKQFILEGMQDAGIKSVEFVNLKETLRKSPGSVSVTNEDEIPKDYFKEKITTQIDKKAIKEALENGEVIPGVEIKYSFSLLISHK